MVEGGDAHAGFLGELCDVEAAAVVGVHAVEDAVHLHACGVHAEEGVEGSAAAAAEDAVEDFAGDLGAEDCGVGG